MAISSILKLLTYVSKVSTEDVDVKLHNTTYHFHKVDSIIISESFWNKDECMCCGKCCGNFDTVFTKKEFDELLKLDSEQHKQYAKLAQTFTVNINGKDYEYVATKPQTEKEFNGIYTKPNRKGCRWSTPLYLDTETKTEDGNSNVVQRVENPLGCGLHIYRPITCGFPHMELYNTEHSVNGYLGHKQYGRNHQLGCPVNVHSNEFSYDTLVSNIYWLNRLKEAADEFNIPTLLPELLEYLNNVKNSKVIPNGRVVIKKEEKKKLL